MMHQPAQESILHCLAAHAGSKPAATAFTMLRNGEEIGHTISYGELWQSVQSLAQTIHSRHAGNQAALLIYQDAIPFVTALLACQLAGMVPIPVPYVRGKKQLSRLHGIMQQAAADLICCCAYTLEPLQKSLEGSGMAQTVSLQATDLPVTTTNADLLPLPSQQAIALVQYTSGSTGQPKGVIITQKNLLHNQYQLQQAFGGDAASVIFNWLPFHHDMGLIGNLLHTIYLGCSCVIMSPVHFIQKPVRWLQGISRFGATHSGGPDFAYRLCVEEISKADRAALDLSTWRVAYNGSETVRHKTLQQFGRRFRNNGFAMQAFYPCYGLAEATLLVTAYGTPRSPLTITVAGDQGAAGPLRLTKSSDPTAQTIVTAGKVAPGMDLLICQPNGRIAGPLETGEICIAGPNVTEGYYRQDSTELFHLIDQTRWLRTGDIGFLYEHDLFIYGRSKEMLIVRGRNIYPYDIEEDIAECHEAIVPGGVALFSREEQSGDLILLVELKRSHASVVDTADLIQTIAQLATGCIGLPPYDVVLTTQAGIPRTTSGKRQRLLCRSLYHQQALTILAAQRSLPAAHPVTGNRVQLLQDLVKEPGENSIRLYLQHLLELKTGRSFTTPPAGTLDLAALGLDSIRTMELLNQINKDLHLAIDPARLSDDHTFSGLVNLIEHLYWLKNSRPAGNAIIV